MLIAMMMMMMVMMMMMKMNRLTSPSVTWGMRSRNDLDDNQQGLG
jgi:hypothetical protein